MPTIDFKEIPEAHLGSGKQDTWELLSSDLLELIGYKIIERPSRGADGGKDLVVEETRKGIAGTTKVRWLVSCKHFAHSGKSVGVSEEANILDRVSAKNCQGFIGFYSTLPSSALATRLKELESKIETQIFDRERIEGHLLANDRGTRLAERYVPDSFQSWKTRNPCPVNLFGHKEPLACDFCGADLLRPEPGGILALWRLFGDNQQNGVYVDAHKSCKGRCDSMLQGRIRAEHGSQLSDGWLELSDLCVPLLFIDRVMATLNGLQSGDKWSEQAFMKLKHVLIHTYQHNIREASPEEQTLIQDLLQTPRFMGGLGE